MNIDQIYLRYGYMPLPAKATEKKASRQLVGTFLSNMAYYGYVPSSTVLESLINTSDKNLADLWKLLENALKANSGKGRDIGKHIVYKNFPKEVLDMSQAEYWFNQIMMYIGAPNEWFTQPEAPRDAMFEAVNMKVLHAVSDNTALDIYNHLLTLPVRWNDLQQQDVVTFITLLERNLIIRIDMDNVGFKENGINAIIAGMKLGMKLGVKLSVNITTATDVLRLAAAMSDQDVSLRTDIKFKKFKRSERKLLLSLLSGVTNLEEDFGSRPNTWKRLLMLLHPNDWNIFGNVSAAYDKLYNGTIQTFAAKTDPQAIVERDLPLLASRPGVFLRNFHAIYKKFGTKAVDAMVKVLPKLTTQQLVKFERYLITINGREKLMYPPRGNWSKVQIARNTKTQISADDANKLLPQISGILSNRLAEIFPTGAVVDVDTNLIKLQTNDQKLASYGRGTVFNIPDNVNFIRAASYWGDKNSFRKGSNAWMDNGFNFFDKNWNSKGTICWNNTYHGDAALFSGDPTNSKTVDGKACQVIDLYIDRLLKKGIRYAVWNILSYNNIPFDDVDDIFASLQWGENPDKGEIYEPSRAQMEFKISGQNKCKYIAYLDLKERTLVYMDANFSGYVNSAASNEGIIAEKMPAFVEYLNSLPSVYDLLKYAHTPDGTIPVVYSDETVDIADGQAFVFRPTNPDNNFTQIELNDILNAT